jgi:hypothetical protein
MRPQKRQDGRHDRAQRTRCDIAPGAAVCRRHRVRQWPVLAVGDAVPVTAHGGPIASVIALAAPDRPVLCRGVIAGAPGNPTLSALRAGGSAA